MKFRVALLRHGETEAVGGKVDDGNGAKLSEKGKSSILAKCAANAYPATKHIYLSGLYCCRETASLIYPSPALVLRELDAPDYKKNGGRPLYDTDAAAGKAMRKIGADMIRKQTEECAAIACKMIILAILRRYCVPRSSYADWEIPYAGGYLVEYDALEETANLIHKI